MGKINRNLWAVILITIFLLACTCGLPAAANKNVATSVSNNASPAVQTEINAALAGAQKDGKLVLLDFGADWCPDCLALSKLYQDPSVAPYLQAHFHLVKIDVGNWDKNLDVVQKYGNPIQIGIPAEVVLAPGGEIIATTRDGALANARTASAGDILAYLKTWYAKKP